MSGYDRGATTAYARRWALGRNPAYYDFTELGGDCTNFVSQCLFAGSGVMNLTPVTGWRRERKALCRAGRSRSGAGKP